MRRTGAQRNGKSGERPGTGGARTRVLHLLRPTGSGMITHVRTLIENYNRAQFEFTLAAPRSLRSAIYSELTRRTPFRPLEITESAVPFGLIYPSLQLSALLKREEFDILHAHGLRATLAAALGGGAARIRVATLHGPVPRTLNPAAKSMLALSVRALDHTIAPSEAVRDWLVSLGVEKQRVTQIPEGVEPRRPEEAEIREALRVLGVEDGSPVVVFPARFCSDCEIGALPEMLRQVRKKSPGFTAIVAGERPEWNHRLGIEEKLRAEGAIVTGHVPSLQPLLAGATVVALVCPREQIPRTALEAMAHARPIVTARVGELGELLIDGATGRVVERGDTVAFADALAEVLADPDAASRLGEAGRQAAAARYSGRVMVRRLEQLYADLTEAAEGNGTCRSTV